MNYYSIDLSDHPKASWAVHDVVKHLPNRPKAEGMSPVFYKFFPANKVEVYMKPQYRHLCCKTCGRYDVDKMFEIGFGDPVTAQFKGNYGHTHDRIFAINDRLLKVLKDAHVGGYETKPLGKSAWHAMSVTLRVNHSDGVVQSSGPICPECSRPKESFGLFKYFNELTLPTQTNTFFTTNTTWPSRFGSDRDIFTTEDLLHALKVAGVAGGYCTRLLTDEELRMQKEKAKEGVNFWAPLGTSVPLNGKPSLRAIA